MGLERRSDRRTWRLHLLFCQHGSVDGLLHTAMAAITPWGRGFGQGWVKRGWRVWHIGDGKVCLHDPAKSEIRAETAHICINFFTTRFRNLPVVRKILFVQYLGAVLRAPKSRAHKKTSPKAGFLITTPAYQPRGLPRPRPAGLSPSGLLGRLRISLGRSATVLPRVFLRGASSRG